MKVKQTVGVLAVMSMATLVAACGQNAPDAAAPADATSSQAAAQTQSRPAGSVLLEMKAEDGKIPTTVGHLVAGKGLESTGTAGQLMFGPYAGVAAGHYQVALFGQFDGAQPPAALTVDIAYAQGATVAKTVDVQPSDVKGDTLVTFEFTLPQQVSDLEVRARVAEGAHVVLSGYKVVVK